VAPKKRGKKITLADDKIQALEEIGFEFDPKPKSFWDWLEELKDEKKSMAPRISPSNISVCQDVNINRWVEDAGVNSEKP